MCEVQEQSIQTSDQDSPPSGLTSPGNVEDHIRDDIVEAEDEEEEGPPHLIAACETPIRESSPREDCPVPDAICDDVRSLRDITVATQTHTPECTWENDDVTSEVEINNGNDNEDFESQVEEETPQVEIRCPPVKEEENVHHDEDADTEEIARILSSMENLKREVAIATKAREQSLAASRSNTEQLDPNSIEAADGLSLLSLLAEQHSQLPLVSSDETKNTKVKTELSDSDSKPSSCAGFSPRHDINKNYPSPFKRDFVLNKHFNLKRECGMSPSRCKVFQSKYRSNIYQ